jgi:hypothetical protein
LLFFMASATGGFECGAIVEVERSAANAMARQGDGVVANASVPHLTEDRDRQTVY